jgi:prepilin signal peptidase PulO-like enzyme (type II secretory pathway)
MGLIWFFYIFIFLFGLTVGSFLNCVIYRLGTGESFLKGRSHCPHCKHILSWRDLIPVLSFLILKGKCRYCHQKISWQYPLVEIATGLLFLQISNFQFPISNEFPIFNFSNLLTACYLLLVTSFLIIIFVYDLKHYIIPDKIIYSASAIALIFNFSARIATRSVAGGQFSIFNPVLSALGASAFFLAIFLISRGKWLGFGDVKLGFFMGLFLGFPKILVSLFFAYLIGAIIGIGLILVKKKTLKSEVPFGPFLVTGTFIALFWGNQLINWYLNFFRI